MKEYKKFILPRLVIILAIFILASCSTSMISLKSVYTGPDPSPISQKHKINIKGDLQGAGTIQFDRNSCSVTLFGDSGMCTLVYYIPVQITFNKLNIADGQGLGREVYELVGNFNTPGYKYYLVVPGNKKSAYRLVIERTSDNIRSVITLERRGQ